MDQVNLAQTSAQKYSCCYKNLYLLLLRSNTGLQSSFAGSMQLLAGVKCCTGRRLTNHPHFEDKTLREATKEVLDLCRKLYTTLLTVNLE